jgi:hypothetical protein
MIGNPERQSQETQKRQPPKTRSVIVRIFRALKRYENRRRRRAKSQHQVNERVMARWTRHVGLFTGALVAVCIVTAVIFWHQLNVMQGQLDSMESEQRPWIKVDAVPGPLIVYVMPTEKDGPQGDLHLHFTISNVGHSPALTVNLFVAGFVVGNTTHQNPEPDRKLLCDAVRNKLGKTGIVLFPQDSITQDTDVPDRFNNYVGAGFGPTDLQYMWQNKGKLVFVFDVFGCVDYVFGRPAIHHQNGFIYTVWQNIPSAGQGPAIPSFVFDADKNIPAEQLLLIKTASVID